MSVLLGMTAGGGDVGCEGSKIEPFPRAVANERVVSRAVANEGVAY